MFVIEHMIFVTFLRNIKRENKTVSVIKKGFKLVFMKMNIFFSFVKYYKFILFGIKTFVLIFKLIKNIIILIVCTYQLNAVFKTFAN